MVLLAAAAVLIAAVIISLPARPARPGSPARGGIVSLAPSITEIVFALGLQDRLLGVSTACTYPPAARSMRKVGDFGAAKIELIYQLKPDLVLTTSLRDPESADAIRASGARLIVAQQQDFAGVLAAIEQIGRAAGVPRRAAAYADQLRARWGRARSSVPDSERPRVFVELSAQPLRTAGPGSFLDELIRLAGGRNIADDAATPWTTISSDTVVARDPEIIVLAHPVNGEARGTLAARIGWENVTAVTTGDVITDLDPDLYQRPGPRLVEGLEALSQRFGGYRVRRGVDVRPRQGGLITGGVVVALALLVAAACAVRGGHRATPARRRLGRGMVILSVALAGAFFWALLAGDIHVPASGVLDAEHARIVNMRAARALLGIFVGAGLAVAGLILQAVLRNPLADPYVLGVSSGAGLGAACAILGGLAAVGPWTIPGAAFAGAVAAIAFVYALARVGKRVPVYTLLLAGVIVNAVASSVLIFLAHTSIARGRGLYSVMWWLLGSLQVFEAWPVVAAGAAIGVGVAVGVLFARDLNALSIGEEPAATLGLRVERTKKLLFVTASLITGAAVATSGLIGFVGLIVPHAVRLVVGPDHKVLVPLSALAGGVFLVIADIIARTALPSSEIPIGVITAFLGGPFFLYLLRRQRGGLSG